VPAHGLPHPLLAAEAAQVPEMDLGEEFGVAWLLWHDLEHRAVPLAPGFELILRAERLRRKTIRCHGLPRFCAALCGADERRSLESEQLTRERCALANQFYLAHYWVRIGTSSTALRLPARDNWIVCH
jgi:hypothetical protein